MVFNPDYIKTGPFNLNGNNGEEEMYIKIQQIYNKKIKSTIKYYNNIKNK